MHGRAYPSFGMTTFQNLTLLTSYIIFSKSHGVMPKEDEHDHVRHRSFGMTTKTLRTVFS